MKNNKAYLMKNEKKQMGRNFKRSFNGTII